MVPNHSFQYPYGFVPPTSNQSYSGQNHYHQSMSVKTDSTIVGSTAVSMPNNRSSSMSYFPSTISNKQNSGLVHPPFPAPPVVGSTFLPGPSLPAVMPLTLPPPPPLPVNLRGSSSPLDHRTHINYSLPHLTRFGAPLQGKEIVLHGASSSDLDVDFVKKFEQGIKSRDSELTKEDNGMVLNKPTSFSEAQSLLKSVEELLEEIASLRDFLTDNMRISEDQWTKITDKIRKLKGSLDICQAKLTSPGVVEFLQQKVRDRKKRRDRIRRKKTAAKKQSIAIMVERMKRHREIDEWQHKIHLKDKANRMVESLRSEAGETLSEVRKKKSDVDRFAAQLKALLELRTIRRQTSLSRGIFVFEEDDEAFEAKVNKSLKNVEVRRKTYQEEETALLVMMEEEKEEFKRVEEEKRKKRLKEEEEKAANDPLLPYKNYWMQAEESVEALVNVRRAWDVFISPPSLMGASRIPDGWIDAPEPSDHHWAQFCRRTGKRVS